MSWGPIARGGVRRPGRALQLRAEAPWHTSGSCRGGRVGALEGAQGRPGGLWTAERGTPLSATGGTAGGTPGSPGWMGALRGPREAPQHPVSDMLHPPLPARRPCMDRPVRRERPRGEGAQGRAGPPCLRACPLERLSACTQ